MAILDRVTITGADDTTDPHYIVHLSERFPFVEWGLLFGAQVRRETPWGHGKPRFPSHPWISALIAVAAHQGIRVRLAYHLCGAYMRTAASGASVVCEEMIARPIWKAADRIQLNFHAIARPVYPDALAAEVSQSGKDWIFQLDGVNDDVFKRIDRCCASAAPLFDRSGGAGRLPGEWPTGVPGTYCGYAGGLGPDNLAVHVPRILDAAGRGERVWIDMETRVRNDADSELDMGRVTMALAICAPLVEVPA